MAAVESTPASGKLARFLLVPALLVLIRMRRCKDSITRDTQRHLAGEEHTNIRTAIDNPTINPSTEDPFSAQREGDGPFSKGVGEPLESNTIKDGSLSPPNFSPARERRMSKEWGGQISQLLPHHGGQQLTFRPTWRRIKSPSLPIPKTQG